MGVVVDDIQQWLLGSGVKFIQTAVVEVKRFSSKLRNSQKWED